MNLQMSQKERERLKLLPYVLSGEMTVVRAADLLSMSERQLRRVLRRYETEGDYGEKIYLIAMIDDATSRLWARFYLSDSTKNNMDLLKRYMGKHGRPLALYSDRASHFTVSRQRSVEEELTGLSPRTQIKRALDDLSVELILARSPQAKGRVERLFGTLQDRLVKAMRLEGISGIEEANKYLGKRFMSMWNKRFSKEAMSPIDVHRSLEGYDLGSIFSIHEERTVTNDYSFSLNGQRYQIARRSVAGGLRGSKIVTEESLEGKIRARFRGVYLDLSLIPDGAGGRSSGGLSEGSDSASLRQPPPTIRIKPQSRAAAPHT